MSDESGDALSQAECSKIVKQAVAKSERECTRKASDADAKRNARLALERNVADVVSDFAAKLTRQNTRNEVAEAIRECSAVECRGELQRGEVKADCAIEKVGLQLACYARNLPELRAAVDADRDLSSEAERLKAAVSEWDTWGSLAVQEGSLRAQHLACSSYVGSAAQKAKLGATCRASCNEADATSVTKIGVGQGSACSPAGYEDVKDDLGKVVECGTYQRPLLSVGTVCECREASPCTQFAAVAGSSERGKTCERGKVKKLVWNATEQKASLECR